MLRPLIAVLALAAPLLALPAEAATAPTPLSTPAAARALAAVTDGAGGTMERRDLRLQLDDLRGADRARATAALARPITTQTRDFDRVRVHWNPGQTTSAWVDQVGTISDEVFDRFIEAGYRAPKSDGNRGGNGLLDIYIEDIGGRGLYGYCDSDQKLPSNGPFDAWAYCAFDNDYAGFPRTPLENLQVTAAHELFHAVQFGYDILEDAWFMEATAAWVEDEFYDDVDDNVQYLNNSPLTRPGLSMDHFEDQGTWHYGVWIFFRFLSERYPDAQAGLPTIVRDMWRRADGDGNGPDDYSVKALARVLTDRGTSLRAEFADFAAANRRPAETYAEGAANSYPVAKVAKVVALNGGKRDSGKLVGRVNHLASSTLRFTRESSLSASTLRLTLDLPPTTRGSGAVATIYRTDGTATATPLKLAGNGNVKASVEFGTDVKSVEVTVANAGIGYKNCWRGSLWSCQGQSTDNKLPMVVRATAIK